MPERLDAIRELVGVEVTFPKDRPRRSYALLDLELRHHTHPETGCYQLLTEVGHPLKLYGTGECE